MYNSAIGLIVDIALIVITALILIINTKRGFLYSVTVLTGKFISIFLAFFLSKYVTFIFRRPVNALWSKAGEIAKKLPWVAEVLCVILAFLLCVIVIRIIFKIIASATSGISGKLGTLNHVLGFILGLLIAFVVIQLIAVVIYLISTVVSIFVPDFGASLISGAKFTKWVYDHNVLISLIKTILESVMFVFKEGVFAVA